jgi:hypothetical protein
MQLDVLFITYTLASKRNWWKEKETITLTSSFHFNTDFPNVFHNVFKWITYVEEDSVEDSANVWDSISPPKQF